MRVGAILGVVLAAGLASRASGQCIGHSISPGPGTFTAGTTDIGNHCDDCVTQITLPFAVSLYGTSYTTATVGSNGTFQFTTTNTTYANVCLPTTTFGVTIFPFWDDLYTSGTANGQGVFTGLSGAPGSQVFVVEWRTGYCCTAATPINDFELKFYENQSYIDIIYTTPMGDRSSATVGIQDGAGQFVQWVCNTAGPTAGTSLRINCLSGATAGACCSPASGTCAVVNQADCSPAANFQGIGSSCPGTCPGQGACCNATSGACTLTGSIGCAAPNTYGGDGSACTTGLCTGACCDTAAATCTTTGPLGCTSGTFQGVSTTCAATICPGQACCNATSGACTFTGTNGCASGTTSQGPGTSCTPNPCPQPPPPANDNCSDVVTANAPVIPAAGGTVSGNTSQATTDGAASCTHGYKDVYFLFTPTVNTTWQFQTCNTLPSFDTMISIHTGCPADTTTQVSGGCNDDSCGLLSRVTVSGLAAGTTYVVRVGNFSSATTGGGAFTLDVSAVVSGACCNNATAACTTSTTGSAGCAAGTTYQGDNSACTTNPCPQEACCNISTGACSVAALGACGAGTTGQGTGTSCTVNPCPQEACCTASTGACTVAAVGACPAGSTGQGNGSSCTVNPCPQPPQGACCVPATLSCTSATAAGCAGQNGSYQGDNSVCGSAPCPFGSCCLSCAGCVVLSPATCSSFSGAYGGDGSSCPSPTCNATGTNLLTNGDFESGSFSGWTQFGDTSFTAVNSGVWVGISPHGGTYQAHFGPTGSVGGIQQTVTANPGDHVTISFWYANLGTQNSFAAIFDGQTLTSFTNDVDHQNWTFFVFQATATTANPMLRFETFNPPSYVYLDDISTCVTVGGTGVCCRGATCSTTVTQASCTGSGLAGAAFASSASACNGTSTTSPCCYANYNKVGGITVQDIFDFLNDWFAGNPFTNTGSNGTGQLAVQNIFDFLNAWFAGGCS